MAATASASSLTLTTRVGGVNRVTIGRCEEGHGSAEISNSAGGCTRVDPWSSPCSKTSLGGPMPPGRWNRPTERKAPVWMRVWLLAGVLPAALGCGPKAEVRLFQPAYGGAEQSLHLTTNQTFWTSGDGMERVLAEFPLPGAAAGRPTYLLYLRVPAASSTSPVKSAAGGGAPVRGFLIQTQGRNAGLEMVVGGTISVKGRSQVHDVSRELELELAFEDGTTLSGYLSARRNDWHLHVFETRQRPADVQALDQPISSRPGQP